jgi:two-component system, chemotaxis family, protein-glutamate methylesterase/glutaminase
VLVAQHMPERFTKAFADRLNRLGRMHVREAEDSHVLESGHAWVCPGGKSLEVVREGTKWVAKVVASEAADRYAPCADRLFESAARAASDAVVGVVLTGMGNDGARGVIEIKRAGGTVFAESEASAVVFGMPRAAQLTGNVDSMLSLSELGDKLVQIMG